MKLNREKHIGRVLFIVEGKPGQEDGNRTGVIKMEHLENINYECFTYRVQKCTRSFFAQIYERRFLFYENDKAQWAE